MNNLFLDEHSDESDADVQFQSSSDSEVDEHVVTFMLGINGKSRLEINYITLSSDSE